MRKQALTQLVSTGFYRCNKLIERNDRVIDITT